MISASKTLADSGSGASSFLKGTDLKKSERSITVKCTAIRKPGEGFLSPLIMDVECSLEGKTSFPLNKTNIKRLAELVGDDLEKAVGQKFRLEKVLVNNPKTNQMTYSLIITGKEK